jgi:hypothetical protein
MCRQGLHGDADQADVLFIFFFYLRKTFFNVTLEKYLRFPNILLRDRVIEPWATGPIPKRKDHGHELPVRQDTKR